MVNAPTRSSLPREFWLIVLIMWTEPLCATVIDPFVNAFIRESGITGDDDTKTGYYAGIIESVFYIGESLSVVFCARLSDRYARRPILLLGLLGLSISILSFGSAPSFYLLVISRFFQGCFNGSLGIAKTVLNEITDDGNRARAFRAIPLTWTVGAAVGPFLGGTLSRPAQHFTRSFAKSNFFVQNPYFLPCATAAFITFLVFIVNVVVLRETSPLKSYNGDALAKPVDIEVTTPQVEHQSERTALLAISRPNSSVYYDATSTLSSSSNYSSCAHATATLPLPETHERYDQQHPLRRIFKNGTLVVVLSSYTLLAFLDQSHQVLFPLFASTPSAVALTTAAAAALNASTSSSSGGLGLQPSAIGLTLASFELLNVLSIWFLFPHLMDRSSSGIGPRTAYVWGMRVMVGVWGCYAALGERGRLGLISGGGRSRDGGDGLGWRVWAVLVVQYLCGSAGLTCYGAMQLLLSTHASPSPALLATINALAQMLQSISRAIAPVVASSLFAFSMAQSKQRGGDDSGDGGALVGGMVVWVVLGGVAMGSAWLAGWIPKDGPSSSRPLSWGGDEEEEVDVGELERRNSDERAVVLKDRSTTD
ncbi:MFS general substrate transporter [Stereum hirsutum FP-91666 SS1]|uniref:MFS general substrate transporter n=1 Tax=Stereum hirsutum (strain FP-91666) TaxID=721885 RepID=UPI000440D61A|nr:MFS general substrate transporter [Stereum hirsutum FP-91666 SS1]EIM87736.1 MFS general substrate transporter [Stereum hirsutum FP-91666 SS1]